MLQNNFMKIIKIEALGKVNVYDECKWVPLDKYATRNFKEQLPRQKESFLSRCNYWYREGIHHICRMINLSITILLAVQDSSYAKLYKELLLLNSCVCSVQMSS